MRERSEDIRVLANYFLRKMVQDRGLSEKSFSEQALEFLNVILGEEMSESKNEIEHLLIFNADATIIEPAMFSARLSSSGGATIELPGESLKDAAKQC